MQPSDGGAILLPFAMPFDNLIVNRRMHNQAAIPLSKNNKEVIIEEIRENICQFLRFYEVWLVSSWTLLQECKNLILSGSRIFKGDIEPSKKVF